MCGDEYELNFCGDHFTMYTYIESLCYTSKTNKMLHVNSISTLKNIRIGIRNQGIIYIKSHVMDESAANFLLNPIGHSLIATSAWWEGPNFLRICR